MLLGQLTPEIILFPSIKVLKFGVRTNRIILGLINKKE